MSLLAEWAKQGIGCTMAYEKRIWNRDGGKDHVTGRDARGEHLGIAIGEGKRVPPRQIGFLGGTMSMLPLDALIELNGFDEMFDGSRQLEDADMCLRLAALGQNMAYERRASVIEYEVGAYDERVVSTEPIKCNGAYADWVWKKSRQ
jgi:cellulose synthase/poly-beta-1,6-N-acetylglucosamine synthase-like glycosyltransferase